MLSYKLLHRDAVGEPIDSQDGEAETANRAIKAALESAIDCALELAESGSYELWIKGRRIAIIEVTGAARGAPSPSPPRRPGMLHLWSQMIRGRPCEGWIAALS